MSVFARKDRKLYCANQTDPNKRRAFARTVGNSNPFRFIHLGSGPLVSCWGSFIHRCLLIHGLSTQKHVVSRAPRCFAILLAAPALRICGSPESPDRLTSPLDTASCRWSKVCSLNLYCPGARFSTAIPSPLFYVLTTSAFCKDHSGNCWSTSCLNLSACHFRCSSNCSNWVRLSP